NIPGTGTAQSVADRVQFAPSGGITASNDKDQDGDGTDDTVTASFLSSTDHPAGPFVTVTFDCVEGRVAPPAGHFTCPGGSASSGGGVAIPDEQCSLELAGP